MVNNLQMIALKLTFIALVKVTKHNFPSFSVRPSTDFL